MSEIDRNFENAEDTEKRRSCQMKTFYNQELAKYNEAKQNRREQFEYCRFRQGDNSQAIKQRNR